MQNLNLEIYARKHTRILVTVCTDKFYHSLQKMEVIGTCEHTEQFQGLITNYFSDTVTSVVNRGQKEISISCSIPCRSDWKFTTLLGQSCQKTLETTIFLQDYFCVLNTVFSYCHEPLSDKCNDKCTRTSDWKKGQILSS